MHEMARAAQRRGCDEERATAARMDPAYAFQANSNAQRIAQRASALLAATPAVDPMVAAQLGKIVEHKRPLPAIMERGEVVNVGTFGMSLLGKPEVMMRWPIERKEAAEGVIADVINGAISGAMDAQALRPGRAVIADRFELAYRVEAMDEGVMGNCCLWKTFTDATAAYRLDATPAVVDLKFCADLREGVAVRGRVAGTLGMWRNKNGVSTFTGFVQLPIPSLTWRSVGKDVSIARLVDATGGDTHDICGPHVIVQPEEFIQAMGSYDPA